MKIKIDKRILVVPLVFVIMFVGVLSFYIYAIYNQNSKISQLNTQEQNLEGQLTNLSTVHLAASVNANEIVTSDYAATKSIPYNYLYVSGTVTNTGGGKAFNAGLHVAAYNATGTLEINMTFPLNGGTFGTDSKTDAYVTSFPGYFGSLQLGNLAGGETAAVNIQIFHEGVVSNWTITPAWTN